MGVSEDYISIIDTKHAVAHIVLKAKEKIMAFGRLIAFVLVSEASKIMLQEEK